MMMAVPVAIATVVSMLALLGAERARDRARRTAARGGRRAAPPPRGRADAPAPRGRADAPAPKKKTKRRKPTKPKKTAEIPAHRVKVTAARGKPPKPTKREKKLPTVTEVPEHRVKVVKTAPKAALDAEPKPVPSPVDKPTPLRPRAAAEGLFAYVNKMISAGNASQLGTRGAPNETVRGFQSSMGRIDADGNYGPKTRARGKELLGRAFPPRKGLIVPKAPPPPPPPAQEIPVDVVSDAPVPQLDPLTIVDEGKRTPERAAYELLDHVKTGANLGSKGNRSEEVALAQADMGELDDDGIYGPKTRARGRVLINEDFPPRA